MRRLIEILLVALVVAAASGLFYITVAYADYYPAKLEPVEPLDGQMTRAVMSMQPWYLGRESRAREVATVIRAAALSRGQDPWIALAIAARESSLHPRVGRGRVTGPIGERGYFQIHPTGRAKTECSNGCNLNNLGCNASTAMCWLERVRDICGDDPWVYVTAYGMRQCPGAAAARRAPSALRARRLLCTAVGPAACAERWPR